MSDYEKIEEAIRKSGYVPKTSMDNLITMMMLHFDNPDIEEQGYSRLTDDGWFNAEECLRYVEDSGGYSEFDYEL